MEPLIETGELSRKPPARADLCAVRRFLLFLCSWMMFASRPAAAQVVTAGPDSTLVGTPAATTPLPDPPGRRRPAKAALWGLIPGGGQVYNRDYWKLPVVYAALGGITYSVVFANTRYIEFARAYRHRTDADAATDDTGVHSSLQKRTPQGDAVVLRYREYFRRNRDLSIIGAAVIYGLTIAEALVDAHLATFTVSDDLSLRVAPTLVPQRAALPAPGLGLTLNLNHRSH